MPISNLSSGLRPGVCTSTTRPTAPFEGQMIYETDTNRVLVWDAAAWVMIADTDEPPGMQLILSDTISSLNTKSYDNVFSSSYRNYRLIIQPTSIGAFDIRMKVRTSSGDQNSSIYYWGSPMIDQAGVAQNSNGDALAYWMVINANNSLWDFCSADLVIHRPNINSRTTVTGTVTWNRGNGFSSGAYGALHNDAFQLTGFTLYSSNSANFSAIVRVYGLRD